MSTQLKGVWEEIGKPAYQSALGEILPSLAGGGAAPAVAGTTATATTGMLGIAGVAITGVVIGSLTLFALFALASADEEGGVLPPELPLPEESILPPMEHEEQSLHMRMARTQFYG